MPQLIGNLHVISGQELTHIWDASAYLITGDEPTLIDCGSCEGYGALKAALAEFGYQPKDIRRVIATHGHWDHVSAMNQLRAESGAELLLHPADRDAVERGDRDLTAAFVYGREFPPTPVDGALAEGQVLSVNGVDLTVIHTPGHTPGSTSFWTEIEGTKLLIAGDAVWGGYSPRIHSDLEVWRQSLDRILALEFDVMTFGHCPPRLIRDAHMKVEKAAMLFGLYFDPWFKLIGVNL